jgi:hypothetical protein
LRDVLLELVRAQQRGDHVAGHQDRGGGVDQGDHHRSDLLQQDGVGGERAEDGKAAGDVDQVGHRNALGSMARRLSAPTGSNLDGKEGKRA